jgi:hypothetical protein
MKKRVLLSAQAVFLGLFILSLIATILQFAGKANPLTRFNVEKPVLDREEAYDPALIRLSSLDKLEQYCDSIYADRAATNSQGTFETVYTDIVSNVVRNRFFHGFSYYGYDNNYLAILISRVTIPGISALVIPNEILKYPYAACSQQSLVMMEVLKHRGFKTRKVGFDNKTPYGGHFAFEVYYEGAWHFCDPDMEPDKTVLQAYNRPDIDFLVANKNVLLQAYNRYPKEKILAVFGSYFHGSVNEFPAPHAYIFQRVTNFLSYTIWLFFFISFLIVRWQYRRIYKTQASRVFTLSLKRKNSPVVYPDYNTQSV